MNKLLNIEETAAILRLKKATLYSWVHKDKIPYVKIGGKLAFLKEKIDNFIVSNSYD